MKPAVICYVLFYVISSWAQPTASLTFNRGGGREERAALLLLVQSWSGPVIFWFLSCSFPCTCLFTTQFSINTLQLPLWLSLALFTTSRLPCKQCQAETYRYISSYVCSSQFAKRLHNTACPHSQLATCVLICRPNRLVIQFKAKIITPLAQHCLPPLGQPVLNCIRKKWREAHVKHLTLPSQCEYHAAVQRIQREKKTRS